MYHSNYLLFSSFRQRAVVSFSSRTAITTRTSHDSELGFKFWIKIYEKRAKTDSDDESCSESETISTLDLCSSDNSALSDYSLFVLDITESQTYRGIKSLL